MATDRAAIEAVLSEIPDPETGKNLLQMEQVRDIQLADGSLKLSLGLTTFSGPLWDDVRDDLRQTLQARCPDLANVEVELVEHHRAPDKLGEIGLACKAVVAVGSGKGGVGKSTIAATLALGLQRAGCRAGLLDADVYGPSIPHLLGIEGRPQIVEKKLQPIEAGGIPVMSMGFLVPPGEAVVWRGPMLHGAITQFLRDTAWGELDYLIIDMPPGTGDIALTLSQLMPLTGAVVVCTPQDVALLDAVKAIAMFRKVNIPVLGLVENMSYFECPDTGKRYEIFGHGGAKQRAAELDVPFLGEVPINMQIRIRGDAGQTSANFDDQGAAEYLQHICRQLVRQVTQQRKDEPPLPSLSVL